MKKYLFLLGVVLSLGVLFSKNVEASETKVATIDNKTVALEKVEDLETISSILEEYSYSTEEVGSVYKYTVEDPIPVFNRTRAYRVDVLSAAYRKHKIAIGAAVGDYYNKRYKALNVRNGYEWISGYAVYVKQVSTTEEVLDHIRVYRTW